MSVRYMPFPLNDALPCMKVSGDGREKTETVMKRIQDLIYRNSQPKKSSHGQQAFRLQQGFLLSSAQQTVDKLISQTQDGVKLLRKNELNSPSPDSTHGDVISHAENLIQDSERAKQLLANLHELIEQKGEAGKVIETKLQNLSDDLHSMLSQHIQKNIDNVLQLTEDKCPNLMGDEAVKQEIKEGCMEKSGVSPEFVRHCVMDIAGADIINKLNEVHLAVAAHISDKLVDRAIDSLMKCHKQLNDASKKRSSTPDVLKNRLRSPSDLSREMADAVVAMSEGNLAFSDQSPMATPQMQAKRKGLPGRRIRPKSVVDCVEGISADDIPDLLPGLPKTIEETISALQDLPPISPQQLKHLGKARPKKPKTRAPTRPCVRPPTEIIEEVTEIQDGIETFFRPGSTTPTLVTPDSDECSTSLMISMTSMDDTSIQSTPTHSSRTFKADENSDKTASPGSFDSCSIASKLSLEAVPRSKSSDFLEKPGSKLSGGSGGSPIGGDESIASTTSHGQADGQKSPVQRLGVNTVGSNVLAEIKARQEKRTSGFFNSASSTTSTTNNTSNTSNTSSLINKFKQEEVTVTHTQENSKSTTSVNINSVSSTGINSPKSIVTTNNESIVTTSVSVSGAKERFSNKNSIVANAAAALNANAANVNKRPPPVAPKPRPWSTVGSDRRSGEFSLGSDGSSPVGSSANTPDSGDLLDDHSVVGGGGGGKISPLSHHHSIPSDKFSSSSSEPLSLPPTTNLKLSSSPSNQSNQPSFLINHNHQHQPSSLTNASRNTPSPPTTTTTTTGVSITTPFSNNNRDSVVSTGQNQSQNQSQNGESEVISYSGTSPVSLPTWGAEKRSVKELAASLARHQSQQEENPMKKKSDSLPRNIPAPTPNNVTVENQNQNQNQDFNRARVSIQEWTRHHSISEVWKVPLRKFSAEKPVTKRWDPNNEQKSPTHDSPFGIGRLRKVSNEEEVVNV